MLLFRRLICLLVLCSTMAGCGESTQEKMMRMAQERAVRNRAEKADEEDRPQVEAKAASEAETPAEAETPVAPENATEDEKPAEVQDNPVAAKSTKDKPASQPVATKLSAAPSARIDEDDDYADRKPHPKPTPPVEAELPSELSNLPPRNELLTFSRYGESVAYTGASQSIGVFDVATKELVRQVFNPEITPFSMSINDDGSRLVVGGLGGTFKVFSLNQQQGLDRFQQGRQQRRDAASPRKGHDGPVTATAINRTGDLVATADANGMVKLWSNSQQEPLRLTSDASAFVSVRAYQDDQLVLGATQDNRLLFWPLGKKKWEAREFPDGKLSASPTCMIAGNQDKGILVGDASGQVAMWLAEGEQLVKSQFQAHREAIVGLGVIDDGKTLFTATQGGELFRWSLPIATQTEMKTLETTELLVVSDRDTAVGVVSRTRNLDLYSLADGKPLRRHTLSGSRGDLTGAAFSGDGEIVALTDNQGRIDFQSRAKKIVGISQTGASGITHVVSMPAQKKSPATSQFAWATADGQVRVSTFPLSKPSDLSKSLGEIAGTNASGTESVIARGDQLTYLRSSRSGTNLPEATETVRLPEGQITAVSIDKGLALIGTSAGEVWSWQCSVPDNLPRKAAVAGTGKPVAAMSLSSEGRIWICDASGANRIASFLGKETSKDASSEKAFQVAGSFVSAVIRGDTLAVQLEQTVVVLDQEGTQVAELKSGNVPITTMTMEPKGKQIATCDRIGQLVIWDSKGQPQTRSQLPIQTVNHLLFSGDGSQIMAADDRRLIVLDASTGAIATQLSLPQPIKSLVDWTADSVCFLAQDGRFQTMSVPTPRWTASLDGRPTGLAWAADGRRLAAISSTGQFLESDAMSGAEIRRINVGSVGLKQIITLSSGREFAVLNNESAIFIVPESGLPVKLSDRNALGLREIAVDGGPRWLYSVNDAGEVLAHDLVTPDAPAQTVPSGTDVGMIRSIGGTRFVVASKNEPKLTIIDGKTRRDQVTRTLSRIADIGFLPDGSYSVIADGTRRLKMVPLGKGDPRSLEAEDVNIEKLAVHPTGIRVAGIGSQVSGDKSALMIWDTVTQERKSTVLLPGKTIEVVYSRDGGLIAIGFEDGRCEVHDGATGELLEAMPAVEGLSTIAFAADGSRLLLGQADGVVSISAISVLGQAKVSNDPVVSLRFHGADRYLLAATSQGDVSLWNRAALKSPQARFEGVQAAVRHATISADGRFALAVFDDEKHSTAVWKTSAIEGATGPVPPHLIVSNSVASTAAHFTSDSQFLIVGGVDGLIRAWSLDENREVARFQGHQGSIAAIAPLEEKGRFVSGGTDRSIRSWRFPSSLPAPGAEVPEGGLSDTTEVRDLEPPRLNSGPDEDDPWEAARQALITGTNDVANAIGVLDLIEGNETAKAVAKDSLGKILALEMKDDSSSESLSLERRRLAKSRREIVDAEMAKIRATYSGGFSNLYFAAPTNFKFGLEKTFRPVELLFADRFLYAARPSSVDATREKKGRYRRVQDVRDTAAGKTDYDGYQLDEDGKPIYDEKEADSIDGDNGALLSWDYRYSQLQAHAWSIEDLQVKELYPLPQSAGVFSAPQMLLFNQDGSSRKFSTAETWTTTHWKDNDQQYLAIGTAGGNRVESDILKLFEISSLVDEAVRPVSQYRSFEGIVTAMAFANTQPKIAFAVRERSVHRLFIADIESMQLNLIEEVRHASPWIEDDKGKIQRVTDATPGITTLAFAPDDELLIAHGKYDKKSYRFTGWKLDEEFRPALTKPQFMVENKDDEPYFDHIGSRSIWFINSDRYGRVDRDPSNSRVKKVVVRREGGFSIINLANGSVERDIKYLPTQHRQPISSISDNGRWIMMGDDRGMAYIWDAMTGEKFNITIDEETERLIKGSERTPTDLPERPAHTGPIVGVAMSDPDPGKEYPAFAATFGEENRIKVWELFPIIELQSQPLRARETTTATNR